LVIEDEPAILKFLRDSLEEDGWHVSQARSGELGIGLAAMQKPQLILLDLSLEYSQEVLASLRQWVPVPIVVLSAHSQDRIKALNSGADDYLNKPFDIGELRARLKLVLRRAEKWEEDSLPIYAYGGLRVDLLAHRVWVNNKEIHLSPMQYQFLAVLVRNAGRVVAWRRLTDEVWGTDHKNQGRRVSNPCVQPSP